MTKKKRMVFKKTNEVLEQRQRNTERRQAAHDRVKETAAHLELLRQNYKTALAEGIEKGEDNASKLDQLEKDIEQAERDAKRAKEAEKVASHFFQADLNKDEFKAEFNEFQRKYKETEVLPILERIRANKTELTILMREYKDAVDFYERQREDALHTMDPTGRTLFFGGSVTTNTRDEAEYYLVTAQTLEDLQRGEVPKGVKLDGEGDK